MKLLMFYMNQDGLMEFCWVKRRMKQGLGFVQWRHQQFWLDPRKMFRVRWPVWIVWPFLLVHRGVLAIRFNEGDPGAVPVGAKYVQAVLPDDEVPIVTESPKEATSYAINLHIRNDRERKMFQPAKLDPAMLFLGLCLLAAVAGDVVLGIALFMG